jgi:hypothetical protein
MPSINPLWKLAAIVLGAVFLLVIACCKQDYNQP